MKVTTVNSNHIVTRLPRRRLGVSEMLQYLMSEGQ